MVSYTWMLNKECEVSEDSFVGLRGGCVCTCD